MGLLEPAMERLFEEVSGLHSQGLEAQLSGPIGAWAAMGPQLRYAREGPWVPWDPQEMDENRDVKVTDRDWPFCWGDHVWLVGSWAGQPAWLHWELDFYGEAFFGAPPVNPLELTPWARALAQKTATRSAVHELKKGELVRFLSREAP